MRITRLVAGTVTAGLLGITPIAIAAPSQATENLTTTTAIEPSTTQAAYGDEFYVNGSVIGSDGGSVYDGTVTLWKLPAGGAAWEAVATATAGGYLGFYDLKADGNAQFKITYSGYTAVNTYEDTYAASESLPFTVAVTRKVVFNNPKGTLIKGKVTPNYGNKKIKVQKKVGKKWKKYKTFKTTSAGKYKFTLPAPRRGKTQWKISVPGNTQFTTWETKGYTYSSRTAVAPRVTFTR